MPLDRHKSIREALMYVDRHPQWPDTNRLDMPIWELVARNLFEHANFPNPKVPGALGRATRAQKIILERLTGTRRMGTNPAVRNSKNLTIVDLTIGTIDPPKEDEDGQQRETA